MELIQRLPAGALDVVGDVHGEFELLQSLLDRLGYGKRHHPRGRHVVFVGDLVDRGPDSPAVLDRVIELVEGGSASCVLGNHDLNTLQGERKKGGEWWFESEGSDEPPQRACPDERRPRYLEFLAQRPLVLERSDLRVVHAAWDAAAVAAIRGRRGEDVRVVYDDYSAATIRQLEAEGLPEKIREEARLWAGAWTDPDRRPELLSGHARRDQLFQMGNPVRILTSGPEAPVASPFFANGKWRMCDRLAWWRSYREECPVVVGHYWRRLEGGEAGFRGYGPDLFRGEARERWSGVKRNVFCVDFSAGARPMERGLGAKTYRSKLVALRWPELEIVAHDGEGWRLAPPGE